MSSIQNIDESIEQLINSLISEHEQTGFLSTPTAERKAEIVKQIAKLRASMNPNVTNNYYGQS